MSTDQTNYEAPSPTPWGCPSCSYPWRPGGIFCTKCGYRLTGPTPNVPERIARRPAIEQGKLVDSDLPPYPPPAQVLRPHQYSATKSHPVERHLPDARLTPRRSGLTDSLDQIFRNSGPLGKSAQEMLNEYKARSQPQPAASGQQPPCYPPTTVAAPAPEERPRFDTGDLRDLPSWLPPLAAQTAPTPPGWQVPMAKPEPQPAPKPKGEWLLHSGVNSVPVSREKGWSDTQLRVPVPPVPAKPEPYPPLPSGEIPCTTCHGVGTLYSREAPHQKPCPAGCNKGRVPAPPAPIPQPMPDVVDAITGRDATEEERALVQALKKPDMTLLTPMTLDQMIAASTTGPTALALEAVQLAPPAEQPKGTDPKVATPGALANHEEQFGFKRALVRKLEGLMHDEDAWIAALEFYEETVRRTVAAIRSDDEAYRVWHVFGNAFDEIIDHLKEAHIAADIARGWLLEAKETRHGK